MNDNNDDATYYLSRADEEDKAATNAVNPLAASIHRTLATRYRDRAYGPDDGLRLNIVPD